MAAFVDMLGATLLNEDGEVATAEALTGKKAVGLYFSAHWCPPCRGFTPKLADYYLKNLKEKGLEIVFVSSDKGESEFKEYFGEQPWLALPYGDRAAKGKLDKKFKVQGIPTLVILDGETGETITTDGQEEVMNDPFGKSFPWKPRPFAETFGTKFIKNAAGEEVTREALEGKVVGIYFSAHWCPPCRGFTPKLVEWYKKVQAKGHPFEIVFASSDREESAFKEYFGEMPWCALPFGDERKAQWSKHFGVQGIPSFVLLDKNLKTITKEGRDVITENPEGEGFPWEPKPPAPIRDCSKPKGIDDAPAVVLYMEQSTPEEQEALLKEIEPVAARYRDAAWESGEDPEYLFFAARSTEGPVPRIRQMTGQEKLPPAKHEHELKEKADGGAGWVCDGCGEEAKGASSPSGGYPGGGAKGSCKRFRCPEQGCDFDFCETCNKAAGQKGEPKPPTAVLLHLDDEGAYYVLDGKVSASSVEKLLSDFKAGNLPRKQSNSEEE